MAHGERPFGDLELPAIEMASDPLTGPEKLVLTSRLAAGPSPPASARRLLEIGCGAGENLLPLAFYDRSGTYVGVCASAAQRQAAQKNAERLRVENVRFLTVDEPLGDGFDYVLVPELFSHLAPAERRVLLRACEEVARPAGLVLVSFDVAPGMALAGPVRDVLTFLSRAEPDGEGKVSRARALARQLAGVLPSLQNEPYASVLRAELAEVERVSASVLASRYLSHRGGAVTLRGFVECADAAGLRLLGEVWVPPARYGSAVGLRQRLARAGIAGLAREEIVDLALPWRRRAAVLCGAGAPSDEPLSDAEIDSLWGTSAIRAAAEAIDIRPGIDATFVDAAGLRFSFDEPALKAALGFLCRSFPEPLLIRDLIAMSRRRLETLGSIAIPPARHWREALIRLALSGQVELRRWPPASGASMGSAPHGLALWEASAGRPLTTPAHTLWTPPAADRAWWSGEPSAPALPEPELEARLRIPRGLGLLEGTT